jgi:glycosyl transferase family 25
MKGIDKIVWINSKNRADRYTNMKSRLQRLGIWEEAQRFSAIHGGEVNWTSPEYAVFIKDNVKQELNNGELGCFLSHREVWKMAKENGWKKTLILEDDALFCDDFIDEFEDLALNTPAYDMLYLGQWNYDKGSDRGERAALKELINEGEFSIYRAERCWLTHAYVIDNSIIDTLLENSTNFYASIDRVLADIQEDFKLKVYAIYPSIVAQDLTPSSLRNQ